MEQLLKIWLSGTTGGQGRDELLTMKPARRQVKEFSRKKINN